MKPMLGARLLLVAFTAWLSPPILADEKGSQTVVWEAALPWPEGSFEHDRFLAFTHALAKASEGKLIVKGLAANQHAYPIDRLFAASRAGLVPISEWILAQAGSDEKLANIGSLLEPIESWGEAWQRYENRRALLTSALQRQGLVLLYLTPWGPPGLFTRTAPTSRDVAQTYRVKTYDEFGSQYIEQLGGKAVDISFRQLDEAFKSETVNAVLTSPSNALAAKLYHRTIYFTELKAAFPVNAVVVGRAHLQSLTPANRRILLETARRAEKEAWQSTASKYQSAKESLATKGMVIIANPPEWLQNATRSIGQTMVGQWMTTLPADQSAALRAH